MTIEEQLAYLTKGSADVVRRDDLKAKLVRSAQTGRPLVVKVGFDPTAPDLHLGHTVLLRKMKHFQDLGHTVVFLIGDFTGLIGDPTGRSKTRPPLTRAEVDANAETYKQQVFKLLDPQKTVVDFNSRWLGVLSSEDWIRLAARYNVAQMLERREFRQRYEGGQPIGLHEFLYPLAQAYDSVFLQADVEMGGTDQLFNLNVGRDIMPSFGLEQQIVLTVPLLVGLDGTEKMSKSLGNYVGITEPPNDMFGKLMSVSDELMWTYYEMLTDFTPAQVETMKQGVASGALHPKRVKLDLARAITADFHTPEDAAKAEEWFEHGRKQVDVGADGADSPTVDVVPADGKVPLAKLLVDLGWAPSTSDAGRTIKQGGLRINGDRINDLQWRPAEPGRYTLQVGARRRALLNVLPAS